MHVGAYRCRQCDEHRGWVSKDTHCYLAGIIRNFGRPTEPIVIGPSSANPQFAHEGRMTTSNDGASTMSGKFNDTNRGVLFREERKDKEGDRDYSGSLDVDGRQFWLSGWLKTSKKDGKKFLSISIKPKDVQAARAKPDFNDSVEFCGGRPTIWTSYQDRGP